MTDAASAHPYEIPISLIQEVAAAVEGKGYPILFVDDEPDQVRSLRALFHRLYDVHTATSVDEAEQILATRPFAVVVSDQRMSPRTGAQLFAAIWQRYPLTTRILFSGYSSFESLVEAVNEGHIHRFLHKPYDVDQFNQTLREAVALFVVKQRNTQGHSPAGDAT